MKQNVVCLDEVRKKAIEKNKENAFKNYLANLCNEQLQVEADAILSSFESNSDHLKKSTLILEELALRVSAPNISKSISGFADSIKQRMNFLDTAY